MGLHAFNTILVYKYTKGRRRVFHATHTPPMWRREDFFIYCQNDHSASARKSSCMYEDTRKNSLTCIDMSNNIIPCDVPQYISVILKNYTTLQTLNLCRCGLGEYNVKNITDLLCHNTVLTELDLSENLIGDGGATAISTALAPNTTLVVLKLSMCELSSVGVCAMCDAVAANDTLQRFYFNDPFNSHLKLYHKTSVKTTEEFVDFKQGVKSLLRMIRTNRSLTFVSVLNFASCCPYLFTGKSLLRMIVDSIVETPREIMLDICTEVVLHDCVWAQEMTSLIEFPKRFSGERFIDTHMRCNRKNFQCIFNECSGRWRDAKVISFFMGLALNNDSCVFASMPQAVEMVINMYLGGCVESYP
jgi:hypothetical protein